MRWGEGWKMLIFLGFKEKSNFKGGNCLKGGGLDSLQI